MTDKAADKYQNKIITIPNILSFFRICLIPIIVWLYCFKNNYIITTVMVVISAITDIIDGIIARKFNMISDFGKAFDPIADKLTQIIMLFCLVTRFPLMLIPLMILTLKEITAATLNIITIKKTGAVMGAVWHGKATTVLLYTTMLIHIIWFNIPQIMSNILIFACTAMMIISAVLYTLRSIKAFSDKI